MRGPLRGAFGYASARVSCHLGMMLPPASPDRALWRQTPRNTMNGCVLELALRPARTWWPTLRRRTAAKSRFPGLDAARGLAVLGMVVAHAATVPEWGKSPQALLGFAHGHSSILFATIAGVSLALMSGGSHRFEGRELASARLHILGRVIVLLILSGLLEIIPSSVSVILASYAMWFILALPMLRWRPRTLFIVAGSLAVVGLLAAQSINYLIFTLGGKLTSSAESFMPFLLVASVYPALAWMPFVLAGLGIGRCGLSNVAALKRFAVVGVAMFVAFAAPFIIQAQSLAPLFGTNTLSPSAGSDKAANTDCLSKDKMGLESCTWAEYERQARTFTDEDWAIYDSLMSKKYPEVDEDAPKKEPRDRSPEAPKPNLAALWSLEPHSGSPFEVLSSGGLAIAIVSGLVLLGRASWTRFALWPLTGVGAMSLTAYVAHIVVLAAGGDAAEASNKFALLLIVALVACCALWLRFFDSGPLERVTAAVADRLEGRPKG